MSVCAAGYYLEERSVQLLMDMSAVPDVAVQKGDFQVSCCALLVLEFSYVMVLLLSDCSHSHIGCHLSYSSPALNPPTAVEGRPGKPTK